MMTLWEESLDILLLADADRFIKFYDDDEEVHDPLLERDFVY